MVEVLSIYIQIGNIETYPGHFKKKEGEEEEKMEGINQTEVHYMHIWKCHNNPPCTTIRYY
jgi:hypothetical protein